MARIDRWCARTLRFLMICYPLRWCAQRNSSYQPAATRIDGVYNCIMEAFQSYSLGLSKLGNIRRHPHSWNKVMNMIIGKQLFGAGGGNVPKSTSRFIGGVGDAVVAGSGNKARWSLLPSSRISRCSNDGRTIIGRCIQREKRYERIPQVNHHSLEHNTNQYIFVRHAQCAILANHHLDSASPLSEDVDLDFSSIWQRGLNGESLEKLSSTHGWSRNSPVAWSHWCDWSRGKVMGCKATSFHTAWPPNTNPNVYLSNSLKRGGGDAPNEILEDQRFDWSNFHSLYSFNPTSLS